MTRTRMLAKGLENDLTAFGGKFCEIKFQIFKIYSVSIHFIVGSVSRNTLLSHKNLPKLTDSEDKTTFYWSLLGVLHLRTETVVIQHW